MGIPDVAWAQQAGTIDRERRENVGLLALGHTGFCVTLKGQSDNGKFRSTSHSFEGVCINLLCISKMI